MSGHAKRSQVSVVLVDVNPAVVQAWQKVFAESPEVEVVRGSILAQEVDAWVTPTNSSGSMDGGVDAVLKRHLGPTIERRVQRAIEEQFEGQVPVGAAVCVPTGIGQPGYLVAAPTMESSAEDVSETVNVALACAAAFHAIREQNAQRPGSIRSVALVGMGSGTGGLSPQECARLMWWGYQLALQGKHADFDDLRDAVLAHFEGGEEMEPATAVRRGRTTHRAF